MSIDPGDLVVVSSQTSSMYVEWHGRVGIVIRKSDPLDDLDKFVYNVMWSPTGDISLWAPNELTVVAKTCQRGGGSGQTSDASPHLPSR